MDFLTFFNINYFIFEAILFERNHNEKPTFLIYRTCVIASILNIILELTH